jgi:hypothetical protein
MAETNCPKCQAQRTLLLRRLGIYAAVGVVAYLVWKKVRS